MAAALMLTKGRPARGEAPWMAWASNSLPVPVSPSSSTAASLAAARRARRLTSRLAGPLPTKWPKPYLAVRACCSERRVVASSSWMRR